MANDGLSCRLLEACWRIVNKVGRLGPYHALQHEMAFVLTDETGNPNPPTGSGGNVLLPPDFLKRTDEAKMGAKGFQLYLELLAVLQLSTAPFYQSLGHSVAVAGCREWSRSALSKAFNELLDKGFVTLDGGDTLRTATAIRLNTFGELPR